jgi:hypothetical protein
MLSLEKCKNILNNGKRKYSDDEVKQLREFIYWLAELEIENEN